MTTTTGSSTTAMSGTLTSALVTLASELVSGGPRGNSYVLNGGDTGLVGSLDRLTAEQASSSVHGGATIAGHADHVAYGLSLLNRWSDGERNPWKTADWSQSWRRTRVTDAEWTALRAEVGTQARRWVEAMRSPRDVNEMELAGMVGSIAHLAYHLGAIRQIDAHARGPKDGE